MATLKKTSKLLAAVTLTLTSARSFLALHEATLSAARRFYSSISPCVNERDILHSHLVSWYMDFIILYRVGFVAK